MYKINLKEALIGTDFEFFLISKTGKFVSAIPFIEGTKNAPLQIGDVIGNNIQHDGVLAEGGVPPVHLDELEKMWEYINFVKDTMKERLPGDIDLVCCTNGTFEPSELQEPEARVAGCTPDFNAWTGDINTPPDFEETQDRCAGAHIHLSAPGMNPEHGMRLIQLLDVHTALPLLFSDEDRKRRILYGKAGAFRYKDYGKVSGVEYRTLSNIWLSTKELFDFTLQGVNHALAEFNKGTSYLEDMDLIQRTINNYDLEEAEKLCKKYGVVMPLVEA